VVVLSACQTALGQYDYGDKTSGGAAIEPKVKCQRCQDARWVCENHPDGFVTSLGGRARRFGASRNSQAAATAVRHVSIAAARST
jgi:hypothetical protein